MPEAVNSRLTWLLVLRSETIEGLLVLGEPGSVLSGLVKDFLGSKYSTSTILVSFGRI